MDDLHQALVKSWYTESKVKVIKHRSFLRVMKRSVQSTNGPTRLIEIKVTGDLVSNTDGSQRTGRDARLNTWGGT